MAVAINILPRAQRLIDDLDMSVKPDVDAKITHLAAHWPGVSKKALSGPWKGHFRIQVRKDWRVIVKPERGGLTVVDVFKRGSRGYDEGGRSVGRDVDTSYVMVPKAFVRTSLQGKPPRNFASEYIRWSLGQDLRAARLFAGLNQKALAAKIGKGQSTVSMAEKGTIRVSSAYVRAVIRATGVPKDWSARYWRR